MGIPYAINDGFVRKDGVALGFDGLAHGQYKRQDDGKGSHKEDLSISSICPRWTISYRNRVLMMADRQ